jgi:hypothetical protein
MSILKELMLFEDRRIVHWNTGTIYDLITGAFVPSVCGKHMILNGGLPALITGMDGKGNTFKSTITNGLYCNMLSHYGDMEFPIFDVESTNQDRGRFSRMVPYADYPIEERIILAANSDIHLDQIFEFIKQLVMRRIKMKKDLMIETPMLDTKTGKPIVTWLMQPIAIDSLTMVMSQTGMEDIDELSLDDKKLNMWYMNEGKKKSLFVQHLLPLCSKGGLNVLLVAHRGSVAELNPYASPTKQLQYMKKAEKIKGVGTMYEMLAACALSTGIPSILTSKDKSKSLYPYGPNTPITDVNEVPITIVRAKNNIAGSVYKFVVSQSNGLLPDLTNYHYLLENEEYGLISSGSRGSSKESIMLPDIKMQLHTVREKLDSSPELRRAIDITAQLAYMRDCWNAKALEFDIKKMTTEKIAEVLNKPGSSLASDICNSRGWWSYKEEKLPYLSAYDVGMLLQKEIV